MADFTPTATLVSGYITITNNDLVNLSIATVRARYAQAGEIPTGARAVVNDVERDDTYILGAGDTVSFDQPTGQKG